MRNDTTLEVVVEKTHPDAKIPTKGSAHAACFDIYSVVDAIVRPGSVTVVETGVKFKIPHGYMIHIVPRSGLAFKNGIGPLGGIIDSDYRGEIKVALTTHKYEEFDGDEYRHNFVEIKKGERIAQMLIHPVPEFSFVEGEVAEDTERGAGGFGSTGK